MAFTDDIKKKFGELADKAGEVADKIAEGLFGEPQGNAEPVRIPVRSRDPRRRRR